MLESIKNTWKNKPAIIILSAVLVLVIILLLAVIVYRGIVSRGGGGTPQVAGNVTQTAEAAGTMAAQAAEETPATPT
ncbi:MAG: hypothetical protein D6796_15745, partial [Caldilineae bacterium]